jgi:threonine dehydratase
MAFAIGAEDVSAAAQRLCGELRRTPLLSSPSLDAACGGQVLIKAEGLQFCGSFKLRGALNALLSLSAKQRAAGAVAFSSGNHAQAVAEAARRLQLPASIVMPADAPLIKRAATQALGARIHLYDRRTESREQIAAQIAQDSGAALIPSFDHPAVMAGQGTLALEVLEQCADDERSPPDQWVVCCSGGGLLAGMATWVKAHTPQAQLFSAEPAGHDDLARSLVAGERLRNAGPEQGLCDALLAPQTGELTWPILQAHLQQGLVVTQLQVQQAMAWAAAELDLQVEPGGAVALAAVLAGQVPLAGRSTLVTLTGSNVDPQTYGDCLEVGRQTPPAVFAAGGDCAT